MFKMLIENLKFNDVLDTIIMTRVNLSTEANNMFSLMDHNMLERFDIAR